MRKMFVSLTAITLIGCVGTPGPTSTDTSSDALPSLAERIKFLERYVDFRRGYSDLGFHIKFSDNSGGLVPGPSDWDLRLIATVPPIELANWVPAGVTAKDKIDVEWLVEVPGAERASGITEWYEFGQKVIGIDRKNSVVAYRHLRY